MSERVQMVAEGKIQFHLMSHLFQSRFSREPRAWLLDKQQWLSTGRTLERDPPAVEEMEQNHSGHQQELPSLCEPGFAQGFFLFKASFSLATLAFWG